VDPFAIIMLGIVGGLLVAVVLLGLFHPRTGEEALHWGQTRSPELEMQNELDDLAEMLEAVNRRRRARGERELTTDELEDEGLT
jgi:hypothetical protein